MENRMGILFSIIFLIAFTHTGFALNYCYLTRNEVTVFNEQVKFQSGDTISGPVRSNSQIALMGQPIFNDFVITSAGSFQQGTGFSPIFLGPPPVFNAPEFDFPQGIPWIRQEALAHGYSFSSPDSMMGRIHFVGTLMRVVWTPIGVPFDTTAFEEVALPDSVIMFFDCPQLNILGTIGGTLILGCSGRIGLEDNLLYSSSDPDYGTIDPNHREKLAVIAENEIKILNTIQNGRENSAGLGRAQTDQNLTSIALNGIFAALNESFTFENQNDPDSGYDFGSTDERGTVRIWGGIAQERRGYFHRANHSGTGYMKQLHYDEQLRFWNTGLFSNQPDNIVSPANLNFGDVIAGAFRQDTFSIQNAYVPLTLSRISISPPFSVTQTFDSAVWNPVVRVTFAPTAVGTFHDTLRLLVDYYQEPIAIPLQGNGVPPSAAGHDLAPLPQTLSLTAFPNPFNSVTQLQYTLPQNGNVTISLFDITGREVSKYELFDKSSGTHTLAIHGDGLASGMYLVRLQSQTHSVSQKLLYLK
jgi:hypothetical protein